MWGWGLDWIEPEVWVVVCIKEVLFKNTFCFYLLLQMQDKIRKNNIVFLVLINQILMTYHSHSVSIWI